ncbi:MAG: hypothetical protein M4579_002976 [Chaenotheca gracillima]|nr:MAG: hypothetical protein M4579_002976 [Chaenotheca gracillima]
MLIQDHLKEMFSVIYTPTEGQAIQEYSRLFRKPEGCFLDIFEQDKIESHLAQWASPEDIDYIVVTDSEEILGIGDQGVGGILISVAKLVLTTLCAGVHPNRTLPVVLDCGTDNEDLLKDDLYLGVKRHRVRGKQYDDFVEGFVKSARNLYPRAYIHFEDFGVGNARRILEKYRPHMACFNDDVQGTGVITLAAILGGLRLSKQELSGLKMVVFGSGTAGIGIADQVRDAISAECNVSKDHAARQIWCIDRQGLLLKSHGESLSSAQAPYAKEDSEWSDKSNDLLSVVKQIKPNVLIGTSTKPKSFTEEIVKEIARHVDRPIILPLSNPTRLHEADPHDIHNWTDGKAIIATGSPFPPVQVNGKERDIAECNNSTCFPGIGLGVVLSNASRLSDKMLYAAANALAAQSPALQDDTKGILPDVADVRELSVLVAKAVIKQAIDEKLTQVEGIPPEDGELEEWIRAQMWEPRYRELKYAE